MSERAPWPDAGIELVSLDLDDTLWAAAPVLGRANQRLFEWLCAHAPASVRGFDAAGFQRHCKAHARAHPGLAFDRSALRRNCLRELLGPAASEALVEAAFRVFWEARQQVVCYTDVPEALATLSRRVRLVALTNGNADIAHIGLDRYFHAAWTSEALGVSKPDPAVFRRVLDEAGVAPDRALHAGDHPEHDILGARRAGLWSAWVDRSGAAWPLEIEPPHVRVDDLAGLARLLRGSRAPCGVAPRVV